MSKASDAAVGMMDAAYFTGRKELLEFFNDLLDLNLSKIEQTASGAIACQLTELVFPGSIPMSRVNWEAKSDYEFVQNYKLLQVAFAKHHVQRYVDVDKLIRAKYQDNLEFCQWLKAFYDQQGVFRDDYDPSMVRVKGKGGARYNQLMGKKSNHRQPAGVGRPKPATTAAATTSPAPPAKQPNATFARPSRPLRERDNDQVAVGGSTPSTSKSLPGGGEDAAAEEEEEDETSPESTSLIIQNERLTEKVASLEEAIIDIERERDFYFEKLRNVEVLLQVHQERGVDSNPDQLVDKIFKILYASAEDNVAVNDEGDVVEGIAANALPGNEHSPV